MENTVKSVSEQLADNLRYYINGESNKRCRNTNGCFYSGDNVNHETEGCFVGRLLSVEDRVKTDNYFKTEETETIPSGVDSIVALQDIIGIELPSIITENVDMMIDFQSLHDNTINWDYNGFELSGDGKIQLEKIISDYCLDLEVFEEFLK